MLKVANAVRLSAAEKAGLRGRVAWLPYPQSA